MTRGKRGTNDLITPIIDAIEKYIKEENSPFSMPGHKMGRAFDYSLKYMKLKEVLLKGDLTEVGGLDNLHNSETCIRESLDYLKDLYSAEESYFLVNGSTSGNLIMLFSALNEGDKVIVERGCHKSIFNGIELRKLKPVYIGAKINKEFNAPLTLDKEMLIGKINEENDVKAIVITYPSYYGVGIRLKEIVTLCKSKGIKVLVDCAHGAHFGVNDKLPMNPMIEDVDMVVMSAHKTLPSLTQTAYLHIGKNIDKSRVKHYISVFSSTSPSYAFMMSMDFARAYLQDRGKLEYDKLIEVCNDIRNKIDKIEGFTTLKQEYLSKDEVFDPTRIVINVGEGFSGHKLLDYLRENKVQCEMSDSNNVILIPSPFNTYDDYLKLINALKNCRKEFIASEFVEAKGNPELECVYATYEVDTLSLECEKLECSIGRIAGEHIIPYPPGIPLVIRGERISQEAIQILNYYISHGVTILGVNDGLIMVIKE